MSSVSANSASVAPRWRTSSTRCSTHSQQLVATATASAVSSLCFLDSAPSAKTSFATARIALLTRIGDDHTLHTHLKMEGAWHLYRPTSAWRRPIHEARVVLRTDEWVAVGFSLGIVALIDSLPNSRREHD